MTATWPKPPPTRILSWLQMVVEADPNYEYELRRPVIYEFSNGRKFRAPANPYANYDTGIIDPFGNPVIDPFGNQVQGP